MSKLSKCEAMIKEVLFKWAWKKISPKLTGGVPQWYKERLLLRQFADDSHDNGGE